MSILMQQVTSLRRRAHAIVRVDESFVQEMPGGAEPAMRRCLITLLLTNILTFI